MKDIVLINNFCRDFSKTDNGRFMYLCKELSKTNNVEIITNDYRHDTKTRKEPLNVVWPFTITFLHESGYKKNVSIKRFVSHYFWGKEVYRYLCSRKKPDVIYCNVPSLTAALKSSDYCKDNNVKFIIDIQDLWPEAFQMMLNIPIISSMVFWPFKVIANKIYRRADEICSVSKTYAETALKVNKKCNVAHPVFIGTRVMTFDKGAETTPYIVKTNPDEIWIGYCGSLSDSYDIGCVLRALKILNDKGVVSAPKFIVMGDGAAKNKFMKLATELKVKTIFTGRLEYNQMCSTLKQCDMVVNPITKGSAASIINKHADYAASGLPVINTQDSKEYRELIDSYQMGINCNSGNSTEIANSIEYLMMNQQERIRMGTNSRKCSIEKFDRKNTYQELISVIEA